MTGKKHSFATMQLANNKNNHIFANMEEDASEFDPWIVEYVFNQLTIKATMKLCKNDSRVTAEKEMKQLHWHKSFQPVHWSDLTQEQWNTV